MEETTKECVGEGLKKLWYTMLCIWFVLSPLKQSRSWQWKDKLERIKNKHAKMKAMIDNRKAEK